MRLFWLYDQFDNQIGCIGEYSLIEPIHKDELNGEDSLTLSLVDLDIEKYNRIVWRDDFSAWHEHIVTKIGNVPVMETTVRTAYCENSFCETMRVYKDDVRCRNVTNTIAVQRVLEGTRWKAGKVENLGMGTVSFYHESVYSGFAKVLEAFGGEYETEIRVSGVGVSTRLIHHLTARGSDDGLLFTYGFDMDGVASDVEIDDVFTRLHCFGKGLESTDESGEWTGGYERKLTFADINGGKDYVEDNEALERWGIPDGRGGVQHAEGVAEFPECEDPHELLELGKTRLKEVSQPRVVYSSNVSTLADVGFDFKNARTGDVCRLRDKPRDLRLVGRVTCVVRYLLGTAPTQITLGNVVRTISDVLKGQKSDLQWMKDHASAWNDAAGAREGYLNRLMNGLNEFMNQTGGYVYWEQGDGLTVYNRPKDQDPNLAIQLNGAGFRIANSKTSNGEWNWRTFGTGDGFTADLINAGIIRGGSNEWNLNDGTMQFKQGIISDMNDPPQNFWNLTTGDSQFAATTRIGDKTVQEIAEGAVDAQTQDDVFNKLTNGGKNQGLYIRDGVLYLNATYINTGKITDGVGNNYWDLVTGEFKLSATGAKVGSQTLDAYVASKNTDTYASANAANVFNKLTNNGAVKGITMTGNNLYINADYINTGTFSVSNIFSANKTQGQVTMAGFNVTGSQMVGDAVKIDKKKFIIMSETDNFDIGELGAGFVNADNTQHRFIRINSLSDSRNAGISFDVRGSMVGCYTTHKVGNQAGNVWSFYDTVDLHGNQLINANVASASAMSIGSSVQDEVSFLAPTKINPDGTIAEYAPVTLGYTNGILTRMIKPKEE